MLNMQVSSGGQQVPGQRPGSSGGQAQPPVREEHEVNDSRLPKQPPLPPVREGMEVVTEAAVKTMMCPGGSPENQADLGAPEDLEEEAMILILIRNGFCFRTRQKRRS